MSFQRSFLFVLLCFTAVMNVKIGSYNMRSFCDECSILYSLCNDIGSDVIFMQEYWFLPSNVYLFANFKANCNCWFRFLVCCDIEQFVHCGGRPYGGVGIL